MLDGWIMLGSYGSTSTRPASISALMSRSESSTRRGYRVCPRQGYVRGVPATWSVIVLAGGRSSRLGSDKVTATLDGRTVIDHVLAAIPSDVEVILVGPDPMGTGHSYRVTREPEPGSGPVAAIAAGLALTTTPLVAILAADMPFAGSLLPSLVAELAASPETVDGVLPLDPQGREQPLSAAYRTAAIERALAQLGNPAGQSVRALRAGLSPTRHPVTGDEYLLDIDTPDDLDAARRSVPVIRDA